MLALTRAIGGPQAADGVEVERLVWRRGLESKLLRISRTYTTGRCNSGSMNRLAMAAKMIGVKPTAAA
jgi:hypothetical protein